MRRYSWRRGVGGAMVLAALLIPAAGLIARAGEPPAQAAPPNGAPAELEVGMMAPDFTLPDQDGKVHHLADLRGKTVVLAFYPADSTPG